MRSIIVHIPHFVSCNVDDVRKKVTEENMKILCGDEIPATAFVNIRDLVGDPDVAFSCEICDLLADEGVLKKFALLDAEGSPVLFEKKPAFHYEWGASTFSELEQPLLEMVAWDLRQNRNFVHVSVVDDTAQNALDEGETEEYDSSTNDAESSATDNGEDNE